MGKTEPTAGLSVEEARAFYEDNALRLTRSSESAPGVFAVGSIVPDWERAEQSADSRLECVDVAAETDSEFRILRRRIDGSMYEVRAYGKLLIVKSAETDSLAAYMRYVVPDEMYADCYDGDLSDLFSNCDDRLDFCGLEIYTALDGAIVAAASYHEGKSMGRVFLGDERLTRAQRDYRLRFLLRGVFIRRSMLGMTRGGDFDFGGRECFYDSTGTLYFVNYLDGVGYATMDFDNQYGGCKDGKIIGGGESGGGSGGGNGNDNDNDNGDNNGPGPGPGPGIGGPGPDPGLGGGGSGGNGNNNGDDGETDPVIDLPLDQSPDSVVNIGRPDPPRPPKFIWINPIPFNPISPEIFPDPDPVPDPDEPEEPKEEKPCFDSDSVRANPLMDMKILGTPNNGIKGGRYGTGRGRMHGGIDLAAPIGTPVYAMFEGVVTKVVDKYVPSIRWDKYSELYGNDGKENYSESAGPHLHLEVFKNGVRENPEPYLYTQFDDNGGVISEDCNKK